MKRVPARRKNESSLDDDNPQPMSEDIAGVALYAAHQTMLYRPPPVVNERIPKNEYGNLDIYVPSMVPAGGSHIIHPETARAARVLGIDYAEAVTGFEFKGRHGTAVISGAVVANEYCQAVNEVIEGFDDEKEREEEVRRSLDALRAWKRLLTGLRIRERIEGYEIEGERKYADESTSRINDEGGESDDEDEEDHDDYDDQGGGGFFPDSTVETDVEPTAGLINRYRGGDAEMGRGYLAEESLEDGERGFDETEGHSREEYNGEKDVGDYDQDAGGFMTDHLSDENDDQNQDIRPTIDGSGTSSTEDQYGDVHIDHRAQEAQSRQSRPSGVRELEIFSSPVEGNIPVGLSEQLTHRTEDFELLSGGESERGGGGFIPEDDFSTLASHAAAAAVQESKAKLPLIPCVDSHHTARMLEEDEEYEVAAERETSMQLTNPQLHSEKEQSEHPSGPAGTASDPTKSRNEEGNLEPLIPIQLSTSSQKAPPSPIPDEHPPSSGDKDESRIPSQPTMAPTRHDNTARAVEEEGRWNNSSDDEDAESLLSQDPEDEDADPEWLA